MQRITIGLSLRPMWTIVATLAIAAPVSGQVIHVDKLAMGTGDGSSFMHAFNHLQDALAFAAEPANGITQIRIAQGLYYPDTFADAPFDTDDRNATFNLVSGVELEGGYGGVSSDTPNSRDLVAFATTLSGDIDGDLTSAGNSFHISQAFSVTGATLDGLVFADGHAGGLGTTGTQRESGALTADQSTITAIDCTFRNNHADIQGGALYLLNGTFTFNACLFENNSTDGQGGAIQRFGTNNTLNINDCTFTGNSAREGGAIMFENNRPGATLKRTIFDGNVAEAGGALLSFGDGMSMINCLFVGNLGTDRAGGCGVTQNDVFLAPAPVILNCTFTANSAPLGAGIFMQNKDAVPVITNGIFWGNGTGSESDQIDISRLLAETTPPPPPPVTHCDIQGLAVGGAFDSGTNINNLGIDPQFADASMGDYSLLPTSAAIDAGNDVPIISLGITTDLFGGMRILDFHVDMGAIESPGDVDSDDDGLLDGVENDIADGSGCPDPMNPDSDGDGLSDGFEVITLLTSPCLADTDGDGIPDNLDEFPLDPDVAEGQLVRLFRLVADSIDALPPGVFNGPNDNANRGRRNALANKIRAAANALATGNLGAALNSLNSALDRADSLSPPPDWMDDAEPAKDSVRTDIEMLIALILL